ncbi:DUF1403 family protein [Puniceibacterium sediminis]|uniref:DUF1403 family protein n=1 Tax=Puniceibacterium sediminis TaxID=1608407 RepID=A0A238Y6V6_9RHOB|nr:DUF1403 family protein [Puniceibacterium sediminis]SNR66955.1 Protein of unknown function [Puniceibacterium sediminis]
MTYTKPDPLHDPQTLPRMPGWVSSGREQTIEDVAFLSGGALATLHMVLGRGDVPQALFRERLALRAAEACVGFSGRMERAGELRDALHLLRPGDQPGPAGDVYLQWRRTVERPLSIKALHRALSAQAPNQITTWLDPGQGAPVVRASAVLEAVLLDRPRAEATALILADAAMAQALGWDHIVPLLAAGLKPRDLRKGGDDLRMACHRAVVSAAAEAVRIAADLTRRAVRLRAVSPKLRAKGADAAVEMFLRWDAVAPVALPLPDRAARRLCDRLVELGAVRELTGRATFRLYGL